jgi:DDE superfamily endonuclease/Helix-turn-helix of DDE superfamily endonuclease
MGPHGLVASYLYRNPPPDARQADRRAVRSLHGGRGHYRKRAAGAGPDHDLPFTDRVIATLVYLRFQLPHTALAVLYGVDGSTITRPAGEIRPLLAARGFAVPGEAGVRLRTLADVFAYAAARGVELRLDGTEVQVRRPASASPGRRAFVSGKKKQNTKKATVITDPQGRTLWAGAFRPGRMHDQTAVRTEGIADSFTQFPQVKAKVDAGYRGLAKEFPDQVQAPPLKPKKDATPEETAAYEAERHKQSSERICVEHANAEHKQWRTLQRYLGRREDFDETFLAVAGLVSDRAAERQPHVSQPARPAQPTTNRAPLRKSRDAQDPVPILVTGRPASCST